MRDGVQGHIQVHVRTVRMAKKTVKLAYHRKSKLLVLNFVFF